MGKHKATTVTKTLSRVTTVVRGRALRDHSRMGRAVGSGGSIRIAWLGLLLLPTATQAFSILSSVAKSRKRGSRQPTRSPGLVANLLNNWTDVTKMPRRAYFPYGQKGFAKIREQGRFYVDRTEYIEALEAFEYQCFTRPPRWGKSCLVEMLACYYDNATTPEEWDTWFGGLDIHKKPTELKGKFEVLQLDFSRAATGSVDEIKAAAKEAAAAKAAPAKKLQMAPSEARCLRVSDNDFNRWFVEHYDKSGHKPGRKSTAEDCSHVCSDASSEHHSWCVGFEFKDTEKGTCELYEGCTQQQAQQSHQQQG